MSEKGYLALVLHAHLPFVRHPEYDDFLEEDWLFEAITETYLPLLDMMSRLVSEKIYFRLAMSLTPPLCAMLSDPLLQSRYRRHLYKLIELSNLEVHRTRDTPFQASALMYQRKLARCRELYDDWYRGNLLQAFRQLQDEGVLEIITCGATHGYLPLMNQRQAARAQIRMAADDYQRNFGRRARGIWLPECAYNPGDDQLLQESGIRFFFMEAHGLLYGRPRPRYGVYAPIYTPSGVAAFGRDMESAHQVWSGETGYPGDPRYREFYRDVGYDVDDYDYIKPYLHSDGVRRNVGLKYFRITGKVPLNAKQPYNPDEARDLAANHAGNFIFNRQKQAEHLGGVLGRKPLVVSMYDAELFGHWWYEGPDFLEFLFRKLHSDQKELRTITPSEYLAENPSLQILQPEMSSWGDKGYHEVWLNGANDWIYRHLHKAAERMIELARKHPSAHGVQERALNQAARELYLAQSSDWAFLMTVGTATSYANKRTRDHLSRFQTLYDQIQCHSVDEGFLAEVERRDTIFPHIDYRIFLEHANTPALVG